MNIYSTRTNPFTWPPLLSPSTYLRSLTIEHNRFAGENGWQDFDECRLPRSLTFLKLRIPFPQLVFTCSVFADQEMVTRAKINAAFPVLSYLSITCSIEDSFRGKARITIVPKSVTHFHSTAQSNLLLPNWPDQLTYLDTPYAEIDKSWVPKLPEGLKTLICFSCPTSIWAQLGARLPLLKTFHRLDKVSTGDHGLGTLETVLPPSLTSVRIFCPFWYGHTSLDLSNLPKQLVDIDFGAISGLNPSDFLMIPRTVTSMSFIVSSVPCLKAVPEGLRSLFYRHPYRSELGFGPFLPKGLTHLDIQHACLADAEYGFLPPTLTELRISTLNDAAAKHLVHLKVLEQLMIFGGKLSRRGFSRVPRSVRNLSLNRSFLDGEDALQDTLPALTSFTCLADPNYALVLKPGIFSLLPLSLESLHLWIGPSHSRFLWTTELSRLKNLRSFCSLGAPYDPGMRCLGPLPPSLGYLQCYVSWPFSLADIYQLPISLRYLRVKSMAGPHTIPSANRLAFEENTRFEFSYVILRPHHPLHGVYP
jgi:hypothetical protein